MYHRESELPDWLGHLVQRIPLEDRTYFFSPDPDLKKGEWLQGELVSSLAELYRKGEPREKLVGLIRTFIHSRK